MAMVVVVGLGAVGVSWLLLNRASAGNELSAAYAGGDRIDGLRVERVSDDDPLLELGSSGASAVFSLELPGELERMADVRFDIGDVEPADRVRLRVAHRERPSDAWTLEQGRVVGDTFLYRTDQFSEMQLRLLAPSIASLRPVDVAGDVSGTRGRVECAGPLPPGVAAEERADDDKPLVEVCLEQVDGALARVRIANLGANGLAFSLPDGAEVEEVSGRGLSETVWRAVYEALGDDSLFLPGGGTLSLKVDEVPAELEFIADNSAMVLDAMILAASGGGLGGGATERAGKMAEYAQCVHDVLDVDLSESSAARIARSLREIWASCGRKLGRSVWTTVGASALGWLKIGAQMADSIRALRGGPTSVEIYSTSGTRVLAPSPGYAFRYVLEWSFDEGETVRGDLELGELRSLEDATSEGSGSECFDGDVSRAAIVDGRFDLTNTTSSDFDVRVVPVLRPMRFEIVHGFFSGDAIGSGVTPDEVVTIESDGACPYRSAASPMFGGRYVPAGETFGVEEFRLIYPDVYGPATPDGDRKMIDASALQFYLVSLDDELECIAGLGVGYGSYIPLQGQDLRRVARRYDVDPPPRERSC